MRLNWSIVSKPGVTKYPRRIVIGLPLVQPTVIEVRNVVGSRGADHSGYTATHASPSAIPERAVVKILSSFSLPPVPHSPPPFPPLPPPAPCHGVTRGSLPGRDVTVSRAARLRLVTGARHSSSLRCELDSRHYRAAAGHDGSRVGWRSGDTGGF